MKWFIAFTLILLLHCANSLTEEQILQTQKLIKRSCKTKTRVNDEELDRMKAGNFDDVSKSGKCYLACALQMIHLIKRSGQVDIESALRQVPNLPESRRKPTLQAIDHCKDSGSGINEVCDIALAICKCYYNDNPEFYLVP